MSQTFVRGCPGRSPIRPGLRLLPIVLVMCASLRGEVAHAQQACSVPGSWINTYGGVTTVQQNLSGVMQLPYCQSAHALTISLTGVTGFTVVATWSGGPECQSFTETMSFGTSCHTASGTYVNADGTSGNDTWTGTNPAITLARQSLTSVQATGTPSGGSFSFPTTPISGANFSSVTDLNPTGNPDTVSLQDPLGSGAPTAGGLETVTAQYSVNGNTATDPFQVPTFGMSCYMISLESDYGTPPNSCSATRIHGVLYQGSITNPGGLPGTYCSAFIANIRLQGSGQLNNGQYVQYQVSSGNIVIVPAIVGHDGTPLIAGQSVARDLAIIPGTGVLVSVDGVGSNLLANDTGGAIVGYRLDLFNGAGRAACTGYANPMGVGACAPAQASCPGSALQ